MKTKIYIWANAAVYSSKKWRSESALFIAAFGKSNIIIFNHRYKEYRKNFKCTNYLIVTMIEKAKILLPGSYSITV